MGNEGPEYLPDKDEIEDELRYLRESDEAVISLAAILMKLRDGETVGE
jgi:hypothetical protein